VVSPAPDLSNCSGGGGLVQQRGCFDTCSPNTDGQRVVRPNTVSVRDVWAGQAVVVVARGRGQPGIEGLANNAVQLTAARAMMGAAATDGER
jgi:hypothetical protein